MPWYSCCNTKDDEVREISQHVPSVHSVIEVEPSRKELIFSNRVEIDSIKKQETEIPAEDITAVRVKKQGYVKSSRAM